MNYLQKQRLVLDLKTCVFTKQLLAHMQLDVIRHKLYSTVFKQVLPSATSLPAVFNGPDGAGETVLDGPGDTLELLLGSTCGPVELVLDDPCGVGESVPGMTRKHVRTHTE